MAINVILISVFVKVMESWKNCMMGNVKKVVSTVDYVDYKEKWYVRFLVVWTKFNENFVWIICWFFL